MSVSTTDTFGTKVEVKNLNSFRVVERAINYEIERQITVIEKGERVLQETRGWDEKKQATFSQRLKETSEDYRYFPDPDLPKLKISEIEEFQNMELPELPWEKRERYKKEYGIKDEDIESFIVDRELGAFFERVASALSGDKKAIALASNYITSDLVGLSPSAGGVRLPQIEDFVELMKMTGAGEISSRGAKDILKILVTEGGNSRAIAQQRGLFKKVTKGNWQTTVLRIISENEQVAADYRAGKEAALQYLVGQGMRATSGAANPARSKNI